MLRLLGCGHHFIHRDGLIISRPAGAGNYAFVLFKSESEVLLGGELVHVPRNSFTLFRPDTPQYYRDMEKPFVNDWLHCECGGEAFFESLDFPLDHAVMAADPTIISRRILDLQSILHQEGSLRDSILDSELRSLFYRLKDNGGNPEPPGGGYTKQMTALREEIYGSPQSHVTVDNLARRANLSRSHFQHLYRKMFGVPVMTDIINSRLEYAKHLLRGGSLTVSAVAKLCGYENDVHFIRQFKKSVGTTPGRYRSEASGLPHSHC